MKENYEVMEKIIPLLNCPDKYKAVEEYLLLNSNLPGPRGNLTLARKFAECFEKERNMVKIIKSNLSKSRLVKKYPERVNEILAGMN